MNLNDKGAQTTVGLPGTELSYRTCRAPMPSRAGVGLNLAIVVVSLLIMTAIIFAGRP